SRTLHLHSFYTSPNICYHSIFCPFLFFTATPTTEIYTLSLHDALPISPGAARSPRPGSTTTSSRLAPADITVLLMRGALYVCSSDRKSTRLNSSHLGISYAVFCLKKKKKKKKTR